MLRSSLLAATMCGLALAQSPVAAAPACLDLTNAADATTYAKSLDLTKLQTGDVAAVCFEGGRLTLDPIGTNVQGLLTSTGGANLKGKFTDKDGKVQPLSCTLPTDSVTKILAAAAGSPLVVSEFKFACTDADNNAFLSWNGVELKRGGGVVVTPPQPSDAPGTAAPKPDVPASTDCQGIAELLANPLSLLSGGCVKVEPFGGVFKTSPLDLKKIADDIRANKPVTITGSYERPDAKLAVTCAVDAKTLTFLLPLLTATNPTIDVAAAKQNLGVACKTADGKRQFAIDGDAIRGVDVDGSTVKVGGRTLDLGKLVPDVVGGKTVLVGGFKLTGNELTTPDGRVITLTADDVLKFLSNRVAFIKGALGAVLTSDKGKVEIKDGKVAFTDSTGKTTTVSGARECSNAVPVGEKLAVSCDGAKYSVDEAGNLLPDVEIADISTTEKQKTAPSGAASLALAAVATVASLAIAFL